MRVALALAAVLLAATAPAADADERILAGPQNTFLTPNPTIDQGELLAFENRDLVAHDVTARLKGSDGAPLFASPTVDGGQSAEVAGARHLTTGQYAFYCSIHPDMTGTLTVGSSGTPLPRPGGGDTAAPVLRVGVGRTSLGRLSRSARLPVTVSVDEQATVSLKASARVGGRRVTIARGSAAPSGAGSVRASLRLTRAGRQAVRKARRLTVTLEGRAVDSAGNASTATARRTLRRA